MEEGGVAFRTRARTSGVTAAQPIGRSQRSANARQPVCVQRVSIGCGHRRPSTPARDSARPGLMSGSEPRAQGSDGSTSQIRKVLEASRQTKSLVRGEAGVGDAKCTSPRHRSGSPSRREPSPGPDFSSDSDVVIIEDRQPEDDEVVLTEPPPKRFRATVDSEPLEALSQEKGSPVKADASNGDDLGDDEDLRIVGETGQVVTRDLPHPRPDCSEHRFVREGAASNRTHCQQCYCYVCDVKASECEFWGTGNRERDHANAQPQPAWTNLRRIARSGNNALIRAEFHNTGPLRVLPLPPPPPPLLHAAALRPTSMRRRDPVGDPFDAELAENADIFLAALAMVLGSARQEAGVERGGAAGAAVAGGNGRGVGAGSSGSGSGNGGLAAQSHPNTSGLRLQSSLPPRTGNVQDPGLRLWQQPQQQQQEVLQPYYQGGCPVQPYFQPTPHPRAHQQWTAPWGPQPQGQQTQLQSQQQQHPQQPQQPYIPYQQSYQYQYQAAPVQMQMLQVGAPVPPLHQQQQQPQYRYAQTQQEDPYGMQLHSSQQQYAAWQQQMSLPPSLQQQPPPPPQPPLPPAIPAQQQAYPYNPAQYAPVGQQLHMQGAAQDNVPGPQVPPPLQPPQ